ncbi:electron transporter RnfB [Fusobacterium pseudoperiodonticum]|uniref:Ion-translocating oxidoreductase complex subunit B n=1 Tax=Fusobacterium pseudoperiodonticum TaxID=2663009 RepID=A0A2G9ECE3_9FUSO|nr:RnfABCDGE type electron transport complex subunit B [Fusobacterium pseudoperiodonticum]ATV65164.1 electron transporter RnfB [Fusobacterium pseudoperiodonticum]PIM78535.1 electron transporter RnfB [Fusobacterium pseudoperiodonticum]PIM79832.1 electron transporter RnfB [Fusobacterium pseudoperiodonticum]
MEAIMMPVVVLGITGILMGLFLAYASKKFEVEVDPKVEAILAVLPGANCGACGYPGCAGYASGVALEGAKMTLCAPGGPKVIEKLGEIMGVAVEIPVKKKPVKKTVEKKVVAQTGDPISASAEFIEKNKRMLNKFKDAFDAGDKEAYEKLENLAKTAGKDELLKYYEEIKTGKIIPDGSAPAVPTGDPISASAEFIEKNKRMLNKFKDAFDAKDKEAYEKLENLAKTAGKDELLKCFEEIKAGKIIASGSAPAAAAVKLEPITATKEFVEKNKRMLNKFKDAFDAKDKEAYEKLEGLAKSTGKDDLLKCFEEIKAGKVVPDPATMTDAPAPKAEDSKKQEASYCSVLGDGLCVPEQNEKAKEEIVKQAEPPKTAEELEKDKQAASYCSILGDGLCVPEENEQMVKQNLTKELDKEVK